MSTEKTTRLGYGATIVLLTALAAMGMLATNIYLPAMPAIGAALHADAESVRLTLTVYLAAFAACQLIAGPLADAYGRRPVLLFGLLLFVAATLVCATAQDIETLIAGRLVQAIGACAASVVGRAMARDLFEGAALSKALGLIMTGVAVAPGFGPLLGGVLQEAFGWRVPFFFVVGFAVLVLIAVLLTLGETKLERRPFRAEHVLRDYALLLSRRSFLIPGMATTFALGALFAFFAGSPALLIGHFGLSPSQFGLVSAGTVFAVFAGGYSAPKLMRRMGPVWATRFGFMILSLGAALLLAQTVGVMNLWLVIGALLVFLFGIGIVNPLTVAAALQPFPQHAGMAAALIGALQMVGATIGTALVNILPLGALQAMPAAMLLLALLGLASLLPRPQIATQSA